MNYPLRVLFVWVVILAMFFCFARGGICVRVPQFMLNFPRRVLFSFLFLIAFGSTLVAAALLAALWQVIAGSK